jgi:hypothetical protein
MRTCSEDLGVAGQDLLNERAAGARQAHHKDGARLLQAQLPRKRTHHRRICLSDRERLP